jgi:hypothetical protein
VIDNSAVFILIIDAGLGGKNWVTAGEPKAKPNHVEHIQDSGYSQRGILQKY